MTRLFHMFSFFLLLPALILGGLFPGMEEAWASEMIRAQTRTYLKRGIEKAFNMDEKGGVAEMMKAVELDRANPLGYSFLALSFLFSYEMSFSRTERENKQESMLRFVGDALEKGERRVEKDPRDGDAFFALALAKLVKTRWEISRKRYFAATQETRKIWDYLEKAKEFGPENYDVYFPMGVLHYHIDHLSGMARFLSSLFFISGDRQKGIQELELAARNGYLLKELAQAELVTAYYNFEKQPARALPLARQLKEKFPQNYNLSFALANILSILGRPQEALSVAQEIEKGIKSDTPPFRSELWPRHAQLLGRIYFDQKDYARASEYFKQALQEKAPYNARVRAWALLRLGMIHDVQRDRKAAEEYYRMALEVEGGEGAAQTLAREYLNTPYAPPNH